MKSSSFASTMASDKQEEFEATSFDFFIIIFSKNPANEMLELPQRFVRLYGQTLSNEVFLRPQCGREWRINVFKRGGKMWLHKGWPEFAKNFSIDRGHLLFFRYKGKSVFKLSICDVSTCQIYYPDLRENNGKNKVDNLRETEDDKLVRGLDTSALNSHTEEDSWPPSSPPRKIRKAAAGKSDAVRAREGNSTAQRGRKPRGVRMEQSPALERERQCEPRNPFFITVMKPSLVINRYDFQLPSKFWKKHLNSMTGDVLLRDSGAGTWPMKIVAREFGRPRASFRKTDWANFAEDNKLKVGDTCTFELIKDGNEISFKVSISRDAGASCSQPFQGAEIVQRRRTNKYCWDTKACAEASKFSSANPFFKASVAKHQNYTLHVPTAFGKSYFKEKTRIVTLEAGKRSWAVTLLASASRYVLCKGFHKFVKDNSLHHGDVCAYELIERNKAVLKVSFFRSTV